MPAAAVVHFKEQDSMNRLIRTRAIVCMMALFLAAVAGLLATGMVAAATTVVVTADDLPGPGGATSSAGTGTCAERSTPLPCP